MNMFFQFVVSVKQFVSWWLTISCLNVRREIFSACAYISNGNKEWLYCGQLTLSLLVCSISYRIYLIMRIPYYNSFWDVSFIHVLTCLTKVNVSNRSQDGCINCPENEKPHSLIKDLRHFKYSEKSMRN